MYSAPIAMVHDPQFDKHSVFEGYGRTETGPVLASTLVGRYAKPRASLPRIELRLVDSDGSPGRDLDESGRDAHDGDPADLTVATRCWPRFSPSGARQAVRDAR